MGIVNWKIFYNIKPEIVKVIEIRRKIILKVKKLRNENIFVASYFEIITK